MRSMRGGLCMHEIQSYKDSSSHMRSMRGSMRGGLCHGHGHGHGIFILATLYA
jgi:hypothetical protein